MARYEIYGEAKIEGWARDDAFFLIMLALNKDLFIVCKIKI